MIVLNTTNTSLEIVLGGAVGAAELQFTVHYEILSRQGESTVSQSHGVTTGATDAVLLAAPTIAGERRVVRSISVHNADNTNATVQIHYDDNGTERTIIKVTLATLENLFYESGAGWQALTTAGAIK
jgi:hypothetical protein